MRTVKLALKLCALCAGLLFVMPLNAQVGINTDNPQATLDVVQKDKTVPGQAIRIDDGNQAAGKVLTSDANGVGSWQIAPETHLVPTLINLIYYEVKSGAFDYVAKFDTKIPVSDWVVFITDFSFDPNSTTTSGGERFILPDRLSATQTDLQSSMNIYAYKSSTTLPNATWCLSMDYAEGKTAQNGTWKITLIAVNRQMARVIGVDRDNGLKFVLSSSTGEATGSPI
ncbi:MAG: hypothetical protein LBS01_04730 [Prevotellaceae bacterium]|jgi:hypothetical protein|nr:hypothetical protein [Prevotellaceae bacterium]